MLLAAAESAANVRWYDRAIYAAEKTQQLHSYNLRYVTPYKIYALIANTAHKFIKS